MMQPRGTRAQSCNSCRQVKLKCDAAAKFPAACTRCKKHALECRRDPSFKRVSTRHRLEEVTSQLSTLQQELETVKSARFSPSLSVNLSTQNATLALPNRPQDLEGLATARSISSPASSRHAPPPAGWILSVESEVHPGQVWTLGNVTVTGETAIELFEYFGRHFYPHIPILEQRRSITAMFEASNLLFWTIILVACKRHPKYNWIHRQLTDHYGNLAQTLLFKPMHSFSTIHAILILYYWPGVAAQETEDPSWHYCGLVINSAMQMALRQARDTDDFNGYGVPRAVETSVTVRALTWMACFQISTTISSFLGLPPPLSSPSQLDALVPLYSEAGVPKHFSALTEIQRQTSRFTTMMDDVKETSIRQSLIQYFDRDLDQIREQFKEAWTRQTEFNLQSAKLYVFALGFVIQEPHTRDNSAASTASRLPLLSGLTAAIQIIHLFSELGKPSSPADNNDGTHLELRYYPKMYFGRIFFATIFLFKYLATDEQATDVNKELAKNHISVAHQIFVRYTNSGSRNRAAQLIELLGRREGNSDMGRAPLRVTNHFGASLCYDAFVEAEQIRMRLQEKTNKSDSGEHTTGHQAQGSVTSNTTAPPLDELTVDDDEYFAHLAPMDLRPGWAFPWAIWDNDLYDIQMTGNDHDSHMSNLPTW